MASCPGEIILLQLVHVGMFKAALVVSFVDVIFFILLPKINLKA